MIKNFRRLLIWSNLLENHFLKCLLHYTTAPLPFIKVLRRSEEAPVAREFCKSDQARSITFRCQSRTLIFVSILQLEKIVFLQILALHLFYPIVFSKCTREMWIAELEQPLELISPPLPHSTENDSYFILSYLWSGSFTNTGNQRISELWN